MDPQPVYGAADGGPILLGILIVMTILVSICIYMENRGS